MKVKKYLAIIPARKGSKRLPNKNILDLAGKPLIAWTIEAALKSKYLDEVMVSTDSEEIADMSKKKGANVPFLRPAELANDTASSVDVVKHTIEFYKEKGEYYDYIILLQPTSPLRTVNDIDNAIELQLKKDAHSITSVCEMDHSPLWSNILPTDKSMQGFIKPEVKGKRSQDLEKYYRLNGAIYIVRTETLLNEHTFISDNNCFAFIMDKKNSIDIDDELDLKMAQLLLNS